MSGLSSLGRRGSSHWAAVCGALALTVVGCGGGGSKPDAKDAKGDTAAAGSGGGGAGSDAAVGNAVGLFPSDGSLVWVGSFGASMTVGAGEANATTLTASGTHGDVFLVRMLP